MLNTYTEKEIIEVLKEQYESKNYKITGVKIQQNGRIFLRLEEIATSRVCPNCGNKQTKIHQRCKRKFLDTSCLDSLDYEDAKCETKKPLIGVTYYYNKYKCLNEKCQNKYFSASPSFLKGKSRIGKELTNHICACYYNFEHGAATVKCTVKEELGVDIPLTTIIDIIKRNEGNFI